jgi:hypothetical protein
MSFKITGLDELQKQLDDAAQALQGLGGEIGTVNFNPNDPSTVEAAAVQMENIIDAKIASYRGNKLVENLAAQMKQRYRQQIYDRAAKARLQGETS